MAVYCPEKAGAALYTECLECERNYPSCMDRFFCLVAGTRTFDNYERLEKALNRILENHLPPDIMIVHGGAAGTDILAGVYAEKHGIETKVFPADWSQGKAAGYQRNRRMHEYIAHFPKRGCVLFWDGKSRGTRHSITLAAEFQTPLRIIHI